MLEMIKPIDYRVYEVSLEYEAVRVGGGEEVC